MGSRSQDGHARKPANDTKTGASCTVDNSGNFEDFLQRCTEFRVYTGDITSGHGMRSRQFSDPCAELLECLNIQLAKWSAENQHLCREDGTVSLRTCPINASSNTAFHEGCKRSKYEISVKLFLSEPDADVVRQCVVAVLKELNITDIDQVIVALPPYELCACKEQLPMQFLRLWPVLEKMVSSGVVREIGVADLEYDDLSKFVSALGERIKPKFNHYDICRRVPGDRLVHYANTNHIHLLAHCDPHPFLTAVQVRQLMIDHLKIPEATANQWKAAFACRYTVMERCTSVISLKGYIVHFKKVDL